MNTRRLAGHLNSLAANQGRYYLTLDELNQLYGPCEPYEPRDLSDMIFNYLLGFAIDKERYPNCAKMIHTSKSVTEEMLQDIAEFIDLVPMSEHPTNQFIHWTAVDYMLAYMMDLEKLVARGDPNPRYVADFLCNIEVEMPGEAILASAGAR